MNRTGIYSTVFCFCFLYKKLTWKMFVSKYESKYEYSDTNILRPYAVSNYPFWQKFQFPSNSKNFHTASPAQIRIFQVWVKSKLQYYVPDNNNSYTDSYLYKVSIVKCLWIRMLLYVLFNMQWLIPWRRPKTFELNINKKTKKKQQNLVVELMKWCVKWQHIERLRFLKEYMTPKQTMSN